MKTTVKNLATVTFLTMLLMFGIRNAKGTDLKALSLKTIETSIQLENRMTYETTLESSSFLFEELVLETETGLEIESWMTGSEYWYFNTHLVLEAETNLELEVWMTCEDMWEVQETAVDEELTIESWMVDAEVWR